jgi:ABC-type sugar transport system ATPase subunit
MSFISIENVSINFGGVQALDNVSFEIEKGTILALCGENGAGKSTLGKIMAGVYATHVYRGKIIYDGKVIDFKNPRQAEESGISMVYQELNQFNYMTVAENMFMRIVPNKRGVVNKKKLYQDAQEILDKNNIDIRSDQKMQDLSMGKRQLIEIMKAVIRNSKVIIFDESSSSLTETEVDFLFQLMRDLRKKHDITAIFVTHKLDEVMQICDEVVVLKDGRYVDRALVKDIDKNTIIMWMIGRELKMMFPEYKMPTQNASVVFEVKDWSANNSFNKEIVHNASFTLKKGEILGFYGLVGAGRTELLQSVFCGEKAHTKGVLYLNGKGIVLQNTRAAIKNRLGMVTEDRKETGLVMTGSVKENIGLASHKNYTTFLGILNKKLLMNDIKAVADRLKVKTPSFAQLITKLSGGNQQKVIISKWLLSKPEILIMDEATRGIDVGTKMEIYHMLRELADNGISIIFISSEMAELFGVCDRVYVMKEGHIVADVVHKEFNEEKVLKLAMH